MMDGLGLKGEDCGRCDPLTGPAGHPERRLGNHAG